MGCVGTSLKKENEEEDDGTEDLSWNAHCKLLHPAQK